MFWEGTVGSVLIAKHEDDSQSFIYDKLAIALVNNDSVTDGHIPKFMPKPTCFFLKHGGHIKCKLPVVRNAGKNWKKLVLKFLLD